jgi:nucleotide-binding universal stress UspA family protein
VIRSVLVPLDGSQFAEHALPLAGAIARRTGARLHVVRVHRPPPPPLAADDATIYLEADLAMRDAEQAYLDDVAERLRAEGLPEVVTELLDSPVAPAIADYARRKNVDLVAMTTHGRGPLTRVWLGSVADQLIRTLTIPVLVIRPREGAPVPIPEPGHRILLPLDGSPVGEAAVKPASVLARSLDLALTLVQVVEPPRAAVDGPAVFPLPWADELLETRRRESKDYLEDVADRLRERGLRVDTVVTVRAAVAEAILELAQPEDVALVAMSTHGRGGIQRLLVGSVTDKVVRAAVKPVLVVRPARRSAERPEAGRQPAARRAAPRRRRPTTKPSR